MRNAARHLDDMERKYRRGATICRIIRMTHGLIKLRAGQSPRGKDSTENEAVHAWEVSSVRLSRQPALRSTIQELA